MQRLNLLQNVTRYYSWFATDVVTNKYHDDSNINSNKKNCDMDYQIENTGKNRRFIRFVVGMVKKGIKVNKTASKQRPEWAGTISNEFNFCYRFFSPLESLSWWFHFIQVVFEVRSQQLKNNSETSYRKVHAVMENFGQMEWYKFHVVEACDLMYEIYEGVFYSR